MIDRISEALRARRPALVAYVTGGFPDRARFVAVLDAVLEEADVVEIGVPFTDPMADGLTLQRASRVALEQGFTLPWLLSLLEARRSDVPVALMSYLNPLLPLGDALGERLARANVSGLIVPDLPLDEVEGSFATLSDHDVALVSMVTPVTPPSRMTRLCTGARGFVYAVTSTGTTGHSANLDGPTLAYLARVVSVAPVPVCAGFGIRTRDQVAALAPHVHGAIVGSALVEAVERGDDVRAFLRGLRP